MLGSAVQSSSKTCSHCKFVCYLLLLLMGKDLQLFVKRATHNGNNKTEYVRKQNLEWMFSLLTATYMSVWFGEWEVYD